MALHWWSFYPPLIRLVVCLESPKPRQCESCLVLATYRFINQHCHWIHYSRYIRYVFYSLKGIVLA